MNRTLMANLADYRNIVPAISFVPGSLDLPPFQGSQAMKKVLGIYSSPARHWVGDGFPVHSLFSYDTLGQQLSPFLLLDYAGPAEFEPASAPRGVGIHPHRGFETVTIVYQGEVAHRPLNSWRSCAACLRRRSQHRSGSPR